MSDIDNSLFAAAALNMLASVIVIPLLLNLRIKVCWDGIHGGMKLCNW
jgi:hypothetical protein